MRSEKLRGEGCIRTPKLSVSRKAHKRTDVFIEINIYIQPFQGDKRIGDLKVGQVED